MTIAAKMVLDSVSPEGIRLCTMQLRYPKFIHSELMTHRVFSRNASSSRAIPVARLIQDVLEDPAVPVHWGANQRGMQADRECDAKVHMGGDGLFSCDMPSRDAWLRARDMAVIYARAFDAAGYHKQIVNRLLEPWCHINVVVTSTDWSNFFALRCHPGAQPEMRALAEAMRHAMKQSKPEVLQPDEWHLPYVAEDDWKFQDTSGLYFTRDYTEMIKISVARCARVSYLTREGRQPSVDEDLALYDRLVAQVPLHASPAEHQATPDKYEGIMWANPYLHGNLRGWVQYRKTLPGECQ